MNSVGNFEDVARQLTYRSRGRSIIEVALVSSSFRIWFVVFSSALSVRSNRVYISGRMFRCFPCGVHYCLMYWELLPRKTGTGTTASTKAGEISGFYQCSRRTGNVCTRRELFTILWGTGTYPSKSGCTSIVQLQQIKVCKKHSSICQRRFPSRTRWLLGGGLFMILFPGMIIFWARLSSRL